MPHWNDKEKFRKWMIRFVDEFFIGMALMFLIILLLLFLPILALEQFLSGERLKDRHDFLL